MGTSVFIRTIQILSLSYLHSLKLSHWGTPLFCLTLLLPNCSRQYLGWKACPGCQSFQEWESLLCYLKISLFLRENRPNIHNLASSTSPMLLQAPLHSLNNLKVRKLFTASSFLFPFIINSYSTYKHCAAKNTAKMPEPIQTGAGLPKISVPVCDDGTVWTTTNITHSGCTLPHWL